MASYDTDSSDENDSYTTTNTLLGYASKETTDDSISQLGGIPVCLLEWLLRYIIHQADNESRLGQVVHLPRHL